MALWFLNFSTWECTHGIYLEDLYVRPEYRKNGLGKLLLQQLAHLCVARGYQRMEWSVLKWNEPSIQVYKSFGAYPMSGWDTYRLDGDALQGFGAYVSLGTAVCSSWCAAVSARVCDHDDGSFRARPR